MSENNTQLLPALAKAQAAFGTIIRDKTVTVITKTGAKYTFNYAPLETIMAAIREPLATNGLAISQTVVNRDGQDYVRTTLYHESGESLPPCDVPLQIREAGPQAYNSALTYSRRYGITLLLCLVADDDDDGNVAEGNHAEPAKKVVVAPRQKPTGTPPTGTWESYQAVDVPAEDMSAKIQASIDALKKETPVEYITSAEKAKLNMRFREALREDKQPLAEQFLHDYLRTVGILDPFGTPSVSFIPKSRFVEIGKGAVKFAADLE